MKNQDQGKQSITPESWPATHPYNLITDIGIREQEEKISRNPRMMVWFKNCAVALACEQARH